MGGVYIDMAWAGMGVTVSWITYFLGLKGLGVNHIMDCHGLVFTIRQRARE